MVFMIFSLLFFMFKSNRYLYILFGLEYIVLSLIFNIIFYNDGMIIFFMCISVISGVTALVLMFGLINYSGNDKCLF